MGVCRYGHELPPGMTYIADTYNFARDTALTQQFYLFVRERGKEREREGKREKESRFHRGTTEPHTYLPFNHNY